MICLTPLLGFCSKTPTTVYLLGNPVSPSLVHRLCCSSIDGLLRIPNLTDTTRVLKKNEHFCQIREVFVPDIAANNLDTHVISQAVHTRPNGVQTGQSASVQIDPDSKLSSDERASFRSILD